MTNPNIGIIDMLQRWVESDEAPRADCLHLGAGRHPEPWCLHPKKLHYVGGDVNTGSLGCE